MKWPVCSRHGSASPSETSTGLASPQAEAASGPPDPYLPRLPAQRAIASRTIPAIIRYQANTVNRWVCT